MNTGVAKISVSAGELLDRISILEIKVKRFESPERRERVRRELDELRAIRQQVIRVDDDVQKLFDALTEVNASLWDIEDKLRSCEHNKTFDQTFIELARSVYRLNDNRSRIKGQINALVGSTLTEEKSYSAYS